MQVIATAAGEAGELPSSRLSIGFFYNPSFHAVVRPVPVPSAMAEAARANRAVRSAVSDFAVFTLKAFTCLWFSL